MRQHINVSRPERWVSAIGGAVLAAEGIRRLIERDQPKGSLWTVAGAALIHRGATGHCNLYEAAGVNTAAADSDTRAYLSGRRGTNVEEAVTISMPPDAIYLRWRDLEWLPEIIPTLESVQRLGDGRSRWVAHGPNGKRVEWTAQVINEIPGRLLAWRTVGHPDLVSAGSVNFSPLPGNRGTVVRIRLQYSPPGGKLGTALAWALGKEPSQILREGLRHFKQLMEAGEIPTNEPQPRGAR